MSSSERPGVTDAAALLTVRLVEFPVTVWGRAREHSDGLQREFALISDDAAGHAATVSQVPQRLLQVIAATRQQYSAGVSPQEERLIEALESDTEVLDELIYTVPPQAAQASAHLLDIFDEADRFCREGKHLLTLATPEDLVLFRRWFLGEFIRQADGESPLSWPAYSNAP